MKFLLWFFDHFPYLACLAVGITAGVQGQTELAIGFFILGCLSEVIRDISELRTDLRKSRCTKCHPLTEEKSA